jgi:citrate lyase subunit beta/citryl-CoA lyase
VFSRGEHQLSVKKDILRRSQLVTPATSARMIEKALALDCDSLIIDLEDAVAPSAKAEARQNLRTVLSRIHSSDMEIGVRINGLDTAWFLDDMLALQGLPVDTVVIPKVHRPEDVSTVDVLLRQLEYRGAPLNVTLQILIESGRGLANVAEIARASPRCVAVIFGAGDFTADTGVAFTTLGLMYARARIAAAAAVAGIDALDHVHPRIDEDAVLSAQAAEARELGFSGKWAIHPRQVPIINAAFSPSSGEIKEARRVIQAYDLAVASGDGSITVDGALVDEAVLKIMQRRAKVARRLGLWDPAG